MLPFKVGSVVLCDDIRVEKNEKFILIGVYSGTVIVPGFPTEIGICWWIQNFPHEVGRFELEVQVIKETSTLVRGILGYEIRGKEWSAIPLPRTALHLQSPGIMKLQMKLKAGTEWTTIYEFDVKIGEVAGATQQQVLT